MTGGVRSEVMLPAPVSVSGAESLVAACRLGLGLIQVPRYHVEEDLLRGTLVSVLSEIPHHDDGIAAVPSESSVVAASESVSRLGFGGVRKTSWNERRRSRLNARYLPDISQPGLKRVQQTFAFSRIVATWR
jgi:hypothetical protein